MYACMYPQGEEGIEGEKGMRGPWGQVVIYHFLYLRILQMMMNINGMLC